MSGCETCRLVAFAIFSAAAGIGLEHGWRGFSLSMALWSLLFGGTLMQERWKRISSTRTSHPDSQPTSIQPQKDSGYESDTLKLP